MSSDWLARHSSTFWADCGTSHELDSHRSMGDVASLDAQTRLVALSAHGAISLVFRVGRIAADVDPASAKVTCRSRNENCPEYETNFRLKFRTISIGSGDRI